MRKVFLEELPRRGKLINWKESIGYKVKFVYDDIEGEIEIIDYNTKDKNLTIKYKDKIKPIKTDNFSRCKIYKLLNNITIEFKVEIGSTFKDNKRNVTIIDREYRIGKNGQYLKYYKYHCNIDGNEDWILESALLNQKVGCNVCAGRYKDNMWNTHRELCEQLGIPREVAETVTAGSNNPITFPCKCGNEVTISPNTIVGNKSIGCKKCSDGISYSNKFMLNFCRQLLKQGKIKHFEVEYKIKNKRYDVFIVLNNGESLIIENHGEQHGKFIATGELLLVKSGRSYKNSKRNDIKEDIYKCRLAYDNNIDNYIQLDCSESDMNYIKNSIENSILNKMFDLSEINWIQCEKYTLKNIVKEVCDYWKEHREINKEDITTTDLLNEFNLGKSSIVKYLKKGAMFEWCNYNPNEEKRRNGIKGGNKNGKLSSKTILMYDKDMNFIKEYKSAREIDSKSIELFGIHLDYRNISAVARGKASQYKGYIFKFEYAN